MEAIEWIFDMHIFFSIVLVNNLITVLLHCIPNISISHRGKVYLKFFFVSFQRLKESWKGYFSTINNSFTHHQLQLLQCPLCSKAVPWQLYLSGKISSLFHDGFFPDKVVNISYVLGYHTHTMVSWVGYNNEKIYFSRIILWWKLEWALETRFLKHCMYVAGKKCFKDENNINNDVIPWWTAECLTHYRGGKYKK